MAMLDRFGYKAKKTNSKKWLYAGFDDSEELLRWLLRDENNSKYDPAWIDRKTICQCTGLRDSEGRLIYENDYFEIIDSGIVTGKYLVQYHPKSMHFQIKNAYSDTDFSDLSFVPMWMEHGRKVRIVGNRFDEKEYK